MIAWARNLRRAVAPDAIVLLYHRIDDAQPDPWALAVTRGHFAEQLAVLRRRCHPVRLQDLVAARRAGRVLRRAAALTFDDGYADNLLNAYPLLARFDVPATVFITTGPLGERSEFWWDELARRLLTPGTLPAIFSLQLDQRDHRWELGAAAVYSAADAHQHRGWIAWGDELPTVRHRMYRELWELLHPLPECERQGALAQLRAWAGTSSGGAAARTLLPDEVCTLGRSGLVEIGAHTVTHPSLSALALDAQRSEIERSKAQLEQIIDQPVRGFSYPFGRRADYTAETIALAHGAGFACGCSNFPGPVDRTTDLFQIPRFNVPNCDGATFERQLAAWFRAGDS
jgi:peptidoglycan/xylan/chitin deacetylase (PgdA/CDA1 family)